MRVRGAYRQHSPSRWLGRRGLAVLAAAALVVVACGEEIDPDDDADPDADPAEEVDDDPDPDVDDDDEPTAEGGEINIGALLAMTGGGSWYGEVMSAGAEQAVNEINEEGGVAGYELNLITEDHESGDADAAVSSVRKLLDVDDANVVLSSFTAPTVAVQPITSEAGVLLLNGGGVGDELIGQEALYNTRMLGAQLMPPLVEWALDEYDAQTFAVIHWNDDAGRALNDTVVRECEELGCEVVESEPHEIDERNFSPMLARIAAAEPDVLVVGSWGNDVGHILDQARRQGIEVPAIGNEWTPDAQEIGGEAMEDYVAVLDTFDADNPVHAEAEQFIEGYTESFGETPEFYGANYYELIRFVVAELVEMVVDDGGDPTEPGALVDAMEEAVAADHEFGSIYGDQMTFQGDGTILKPAGVYRVEDGSLNRFAALEEDQVVPE